VINDNLLMAIRAVSDAAAANAKGIERIADRLCGANDNRNCIFVNSAEGKGTEVSDCNISYSIGAIRSRDEEKNPDPWQAVADRAQLLDY